MSIRTWVASSRETLVRVLTTTDVKSTLRNYLVAAFVGGLIAGAILATLWAAVALIAAMTLGVGIGYATRSYISHRRREAFRRRQTDSWQPPDFG